MFNRIALEHHIQLFVGSMRVEMEYAYFSEKIDSTLRCLLRDCFHIHQMS
jgi:hypothetical protein